MTFEAVGSEVAMGVRRHRRYSTEFKLQLVEAYLAGDGSAKGLADAHGICHSLILIWAEKYRQGALTLDVQSGRSCSRTMSSRPRPYFGDHSA